MQPFNYLIADTLDAALAEYAENRPALKAGGIDLVDRMKERLATPAVVLSLGEVEALRYIEPEGEGVRLGCLTTLADIGRSELLNSRYAALAESAGHAATPQVRERATLGGNLCQRPRCWYFRAIHFHCLKKGGATCFAVEGENQYHAVLGGGPCHIVHPSNCAPPLVAMEALFVVRRAGAEERVIPAREFFVLPSSALDRENVLAPGEILTEVRIPRAPDQSATIELREKQSFDWPLAMASVARVEGRRWNVCLGAVAPVPWVSEEAAEVLGSADITPELAARAGEAAAQAAQPMSDNGYKTQLIKVAVKRALLKAAGQEVPA